MLLSEDIIQFHPVLGKTLRPGIRRVLKHPEWGEYVLQANNFGFRNSRDFSYNKTQGKRILIFGDSNAFGNGVSNDARFPDILETMIPGIEIYNFSMEGFALDQQYLCYQEIGSKFEHDLIISAPAIETIRKLTTHYEITGDENNIQRCYARPYFKLVNGKLKRGNIPLREGYIDPDSLPKAERGKIHRGNIFSKVGNMLQKVKLKDAVLRNVHYQPFPEYDNPETPAWKIMRAIFLDWIASCGKPFLILPLPRYIYVREHANAKHYQERFREVASESGCFLYDPLPDLHRLSMEERRKMYYLEGHLTPFGHANLAKMMAPYLQDVLSHVL
ncbi:MAG: hypothetical protein ONB11_07340 [candidate division KSB1 bacterium]|nr:hypothetical protein [candidate division KSB1 bacterium]